MATNQTDPKLVSFLTQELKKGNDKESIFEEAVKKGWPLKDIMSAFKALHTAKETPSSIPGFLELFEKATALYRNRWKTAIGMLVLPVLLAFVGNLLFRDTLIALQTTDTLKEVDAAMLGGGLIVIAATLVFYFLGFLGIIMFILHPSDISHSQLYAKARAVLFPYLWVSFLVSALVGSMPFLGSFLLFIPAIGTILFAAVLLFTIHLWIRYLFAPFIVADRKERGLAALQQSSVYVEGHWWSVFGQIFLITTFSLFANILLGSVVSSFSSSILLINSIGALFTLLWSPLVIIYTTLLYKHLKEAGI